MQLIVPSMDHLSSYVAALETGWSPNNVRNVSAEQLAAIRENPVAFIAGLTMQGGTITLPDGTAVPKLPFIARWIWDGAFCGSISLRWQEGTDALPPHVLGHIGYAVVPASTRHEDGVAALRARLANGTSVLVGQSGVGKSSLTNALVPDIEAAVAEVSRASETGRHTTTTSSLHVLPSGGELIDSPGVRDFAPPLPPPRAVAGGYVEIASLAGECRFRDCLHRHEPGCRVVAAAGEGLVSARRLESYRRLLALAEEMSSRAAARVRR